MDAIHNHLECILEGRVVFAQVRAPESTDGCSGKLLTLARKLVTLIQGVYGSNAVGKAHAVSTQFLSMEDDAEEFPHDTYGRSWGGEVRT